MERVSDRICERYTYDYVTRAGKHKSELYELAISPGYRIRIPSHQSTKQRSNKALSRPASPHLYFFTMASHDLHFTVSQDGTADPNVQHDSPAMPSSPQQPSGSMDCWGGRLAASSHPFVCIFHFLFKGLALFFYIFGGWFASDSNGGFSDATFIVVTIICMLLLAADFWVVKNITGRLLVGLRWWNKVEGDTTKWVFESAEDREANAFDSSVFWTVLYATPLIWSGLLFVGILKFNLGWIIIVVMAFTTSSANVYGYYKCSTDQKARFQQMMQNLKID
jgi:hypothetical protein